MKLKKHLMSATLALALMMPQFVPIQADDTPQPGVDTRSVDSSGNPGEPSPLSNSDESPNASSDTGNQDGTPNPAQPVSPPISPSPSPSPSPVTRPSNEEHPRWPDPVISYVGDIRIHFDARALPVFKDSEATDLTFTLQNVGRDLAENITVTPVLSEDVKEWPFEIERNDYSVQLKELKPLRQVKKNETYKDEDDKEHPYGEVTIKGLKVREGVPAGYLPIKFNITYYNTKSKIKNIIKDVKYFVRHEVTVVPTEPAPSEAPTEEPGGDWFGGGGGGGLPEKTNVPRLLLRGFESDPKEVQAGQYFKLKLKFENSSKETLLQNIKLTLSATDAAFLPKTGSSTLYIDQIDAEGKAEVSIEYLPLATLEQKPYPITIHLEYEDKDHNALTADETISIPVYQKARADFGKIEMLPDNISVGDSSNLIFDVLNKGKSILYNTQIAFPENGILKGDNQFIGNINSGESKSVDLTVYADRAAQTPDEKPYLELVFEDALGNETRIKKEIQLAVEEGLPGDLDGMGDATQFDSPGDMTAPYDDMHMSFEDLSGQDQGMVAKYAAMPLPVQILIPILLALVLLAVITVLRRKIRRRKEEDDEI